MKSLLLVVMLLAQAPNSAQVPTGTITGRLLGSNGAAAVGVRVSAMPVEASAKTAAATPNEVPVLTALTQTDAAGRYRLENLPPGRYYIVAGFLDSSSFYPGVASVSGATAVSVASRATVSGIDFQALRSSTGLTLKGRLKRDSNEGVGGLDVYLGGIDQASNAKTAADGSFEFPKLRPGSYTISVSAPNFPPQPVVLTNSDITGLEFIVPWTVEVKGSMTVAGGGPRPNLTLTFAGGSRGITTANLRDSFSIGLAEGAYAVTVNGLPSGYVIQSIMAGSTNLLSEPLKLSRTSSPPPVDVTLGVTSPPPWVKVTGRVNGLPSSRTAEVRLTLTGASGDSGEVAVGPDGSFEFPKLLPGTYYINIRPTPIALPPFSLIVPTVDLNGVVISVPAAKEITGRVVVEDGAPLPSTILTVVGNNNGNLTFSPESNPPTLAQLLVATPRQSTAITVPINLQQDGTFKVSLPEGQYRISAIPQNRDFNGLSSYLVKAFTYGTADLTKDSISVIAADAANLSITFGTASAASWSMVSGRVKGVDSSFLAATPVTVTLRGSGLLTPLTAPVKADGTFEFPKVFAGSYNARVVPTSNAGTVGNMVFSAATATINPNGTDITGLEIAVPRQKEISGRITLEGRGFMPAFAIPMSPIAAGPDSQFFSMSISPRPDGTFKVTVREGERMAASSNNLPLGYAIKSMLYGTTDLLKSPMKVLESDTAELRVTLTTPDLPPVRVSGKITGGDDTLISRGQVTLTLNAAGSASSSTVPVNADRTFQFAEVFPGNYTLRASGPGVLNSPNVPVTVSNADISNIEIVVPRQKEISGRVIVEGLAPMPRLQIPIQLSAPIAGVTSTSQFINVSPQANGIFRVPLLVGEYQPGTVNGLPPGYSVKAVTYGTTDIFKAPMKIVESANEELVITLTTSGRPPVGVGGRITGMDVSSLGRGPLSVTLSSSSYAATLSTPVKPDATFEFPDVFPGSYNARVSGPGVLNTGNVTVTVANTDVQNIEIVVPRQKEISGRVILEGGGAMPRFQLPMPLVTGSSNNLTQTTNFSLQSDGTFKVTLLIGEHQLGPALGLPTGYSIKAASYGATDVLKNPMKIVESATEELRITLTAPAPPSVGVGGHVIGLSESVLTRGAVIATLSGPTYLATPNVPLAKDGTFEFKGIYPGSYTVRISGPGVTGLNSLPVTVADTDIRNLEISVPRQKEITGRVTLEGSGPMARLNISLLSLTGAPATGIGGLQYAAVGPPSVPNMTVSSLPDGTIRLSLQEGEYRVGPVNGLPPGYALKSLTYGSTDILKSPLKVALSDSFELQAIVTTSGASSVRVSGRVIGLDTNSFNRGPVNASMLSGMYGAALNATVNPDGSFEFPAVYPGVYSLRAAGPAVLSSPNLNITVAGADVRNIEIRVPSLTDVTGHLVIEGGGPYPSFAIPLGALPTIAGSTGSTGTLPAIRPGPDGTFHIGLPAGEIRVQNFLGLPPGYTLKSFTYGSTDLLKNPLKVEPTDTLELQITLVNKATPVKVSGRVEGLDLSTLSTNPARVTLSSGSLAQFIEADVRADGTFEFPSVYPGNYRISGPPRSGPFLQAGTPLVVADKAITGLVVTVPK